jgi:hypothetical protein
VRGLQTYDLPIILGVVVIVTSSIVVLNLIVDLLYGLLDPRVRFSKVDAEEDLAVPVVTERAPKPAAAEVPL